MGVLTCPILLVHKSWKIQELLVPLWIFIEYKSVENGYLFCSYIFEKNTNMVKSCLLAPLFMHK